MFANSVLRREMIRNLAQTAKLGNLGLKNGQGFGRALNRVNYYSSDTSKHVNSPYPDIEKVRGFTIPEYLRENIGPWHNATAFIDLNTGEQYTHGELYKHSKSFATALLKMGHKRGDKGFTNKSFKASIAYGFFTPIVVGIVLSNCPQFPLVLLGIWEAGLTASPLNPAYTSEELARQLDMAEAKTCITSPEYFNVLQKERGRSAHFKNIIIIGEPHEGAHTFSEMIKQEPNPDILAKGSEMDTEDFVALLPFSSGTTGPPKAVMLTHSNICTNLKQATQPGILMSTRFEGGNEQDRLICVLPMFHAYGLAGLIMNGLWNGAKVHTLPRFEVNSFLKTWREAKPTVAHLVTPLINMIVHSKDYGKDELMHLKSILAAAAPIGVNLINGILDKAGQYIFFQEGYGMTELSPVSHILLPITQNKKRGSCGSPVPSTETKIVDLKSGEILGRNERGEILVRGPQVMKGYYKNEKATRETIDDEGWLHTGDIGYYDNEGMLYIVDRCKELIKVKGFQVAPSELEDVLRNHPEVGDVAVIGVPHEESGEAPRAYIVPSKKGWENDKSIHEYLKEKVATFKQLKGGIEFVDAIPKAPSGKILRRELSLEYKRKNNIPTD